MMTPRTQIKHRQKIRVYVAGPYTKPDPRINTHNAIKAAAELMDAGYAPYVPHLNHLWHTVAPRPPSRTGPAIEPTDGSCIPAVVGYNLSNTHRRCKHERREHRTYQGIQNAAL